MPLVGDPAPLTPVSHFLRRDGDDPSRIAQVQNRFGVSAQVGQPMPGAGCPRQDDPLVDDHVPDLDAAFLAALTPDGAQVARAGEWQPIRVHVAKGR